MISHLCARGSEPDHFAHVRKQFFAWCGLFFFSFFFSTHVCKHVMNFMCSRASWPIAFEIKLSIYLFIRLKQKYTK